MKRRRYYVRPKVDFGGYRVAYIDRQPAKAQQFNVMRFLYGRA